jgi:hypothetical protein
MVKREEEEDRPMPPVLKQRPDSTDREEKPLIGWHQRMVCPAPYHKGKIPPPGSDLCDYMLTCDGCWRKMKLEPTVECVVVHGAHSCLSCRWLKIRCSRCPEGGLYTPPPLFLVGSSRNPGTPTRNGRIPGGFLEELPGIFSEPMPTEMIIPSTLQSWRIPGCSSGTAL